MVATHDNMPYCSYKQKIIADVIQAMSQAFRMLRQKQNSS